MQDKKEIARSIAAAAEAAGGRAYFVGGYVRDRLMNCCGESPDIDVEVHGILPDKLKEILSAYGEPLSVGSSFGIYTVRGADIDVAMPRTETATGRGHRDFETFVDPFLGTKKAAMRRDFTINAMMEDILTGEIIDHFGGRDDLEKGIIRHVNDISFPEDPLRVLRAAQFAARFEFTVAPETLELCRGIDLSSLPGERIEGEMKKALLKSRKPSVFFEVLNAADHIADIFPELYALQGVKQDPLFHSEGDVWVHTMMVLDEAAKLRSGAVRPFPYMLSALFHDLGKPATTSTGEDGRIHSYMHETVGIPVAEKALKRFTGDKSVISYVKNMILLHMQPNTLAWQKSSVKATNKMFDRSVEPYDLILLGLADSYGMTHDRPYYDSKEYLLERFELFKELMSRPYVTGGDLIKAGLKPGPVMGDALEYAHKLRLAGIEKENALKQTLRFAEQAEKKKQ